MRRQDAAVCDIRAGPFGELADYEDYGQLFGIDPDFIAADKIRDESGCVLRYDRSFMRPLLVTLD